MTNTELHHLLNRAIDGVVLHGESDRLRELVRGLEQMIESQGLHITELKRTYTALSERAAEDRAAIERVQGLRTIAPDGAQGPTWAALDLAIRDALDQAPAAEETHVVTDDSDEPEHADDCPGCEEFTLVGHISMQPSSTTTA
ncbi:hypothetical protein [Streptomyces sp. NPDC056227]|uniref:hypothetical protein n=1 Tax=Streptomyces sp. NPDC056227 TaxID=3345753 RepID=UPI0035D90374